MAVPGDLTATTTVTEAFDKCGIDNPSDAQVTRAEGYFLREIINDIWTRKDKYDNPVKWKILQSIYLQLTTIGISKYAFTSDFDDEISLSFLDGDHTGTAQAGTETTITLEDEEDASVEDVEGNYILTTGGTGSSQLRQVTDYDDPADETYVATIATAWTTNPDETTTYRIINTVTELDEDSTIGMGSLGSSFGLGIPSGYARTTEDEYDYFILDKPPNASTYAIFYRYYTNPNKLDLTSAVMTRLYNNWQTVLTTGCAWKVAEDEDDNRWKIFKDEYEKAVMNLIAKESPASGEFQGFTL
jgi:hypothetical protein